MSPSAGESSEQREVTTVLRDLAWTIHRRVPDVSSIDPLPATELVILKSVLDSPGITVGEVSRRLGLRQSNTSAALRTLIERELVVRQNTPHDRRVSMLVPTEKAQAEDHIIADAWSGPIRNALAQLDAGHAAAIEAASEALEALDHMLHREQTAQHSSQ